MAVHLDRVEARAKLAPRREPYWHRLAKSRYLGFRRMSKAAYGTWLARVYDGQKFHQKPLGEFATPLEKDRFDVAKAAAEEWFAHLGLGGSVKSATVEEAFRAYVEELKIENSEAASVDAAGRFRRLVYGDPIAQVELPKLTATQMAGWKKRVLARGGSHGSYNRNATALRAALNLALKRRVVSSDHAWVDELAPFENADGRRELYLPLRSRRKLVGNVSEEAQSLVRAFALLPLRPGDVAALKVADFDARHAVLSVPRGKTKSRKLPLSGELLAHVKACAKGKGPQEFLFSRADGQKWKKEGWRDVIKDECLNRIIFIGRASLCRAVAEYMDHYHGERNHQGLGNRLIRSTPSALQGVGMVRRQQRLGGMLNVYCREAA